MFRFTEAATTSNIPASVERGDAGPPLPVPVAGILTPTKQQTPANSCERQPGLARCPGMRPQKISVAGDFSTFRVT